jgi:hypothetical protein
LEDIQTPLEILLETEIGPWWRSIQDSIGTRAKLWKWQIGKVESEICKLCNIFEENIEDFAAQYQKKRSTGQI